MPTRRDCLFCALEFPLVDQALSRIHVRSWNILAKQQFSERGVEKIVGDIEILNDGLLQEIQADLCVFWMKKGYQGATGTESLRAFHFK